MFLGLDFETSGTDHDLSAPIQLGMASPDGAVFDMLVGGWDWDDPKMVAYEARSWSEEAFGVHGITKDRLLSAPKPTLVDTLAVEWLDKHIPRHPAGRIPVGWNVSGFDVPFLRQHFPKTARAMSYRSVDLNAIVFFLDSCKIGKYADIKRTVKLTAAMRIAGESGQQEKWHDAGYDALASLYAYQALVAIEMGA